MLRRVVRHVQNRYQSAVDPVGYARRLGVTVGQDCRLVAIGPATFGSEPYLIRLGDHVAIASGARFITHDGGAWVFRRKYPDLDLVAPIVVHDNVMIGLNAVILPGVEIGPDAVVAAGAVVARSVPPGTVVGGVPARRICSLEEYEASVLSRAIHVAHLPLAERTAIYATTSLRNS